jgi:dTDP-4-dehydrorhamnose reductase
VVGATVVRTSATFGARGRSIVSTILDLAADPDRSLEFVDDQRTRPTSAAELAAVIARLGRDRVPGVVHVAGATGMSWFELARAVLAAAGLDPDRVRAVSTATLDPPRPAPRPAHSELDGVVLRSLGIPGPGPLEPALAGVVAALRA